MRKIIERHRFEKPIETTGDAESAWGAIREHFPEVGDGRHGALISTTTGNIYITEEGAFDGIGSTKRA